MVTAFKSATSPIVGSGFCVIEIIRSVPLSADILNKVAVSGFAVEDKELKSK